MSQVSASNKEWFGHPRGLFTLSMTEMWERFSYYGMRAILLLYMVAPVANGGLGFSDKYGNSVLGTYMSSVYLTSILGGWLADKYFGLRRSVLYGGILIACGHYSMVVPTLATFYLGLFLIVCGTGLLKPNVSSIVGTLYRSGDARRDAGFSIFYIGINLGAFIAPLVVGYLGQKVNWHWGFGAAGLFMTFGLVQYVLGMKHLEPVEEAKPNIANVVAGAENAKEEPLTPEEKKRLWVIGILFIFSAVFWCGFEQASSSLTLFADRMTRLTFFGWTFPSSWFQSVEPLFVILLATPISILWVKLGRRDPSPPSKFAIGLLALGLGFLLIVPASAMAQGQGIRVSPLWLVGLYFLHAVGELALSPVGLSTVTKLAPRRIVGLMMGCWFVSLAVGNKVAGVVGGLFSSYPLPTVFGSVAAIALISAFILLFLVRPIRRLTGDTP
jgi:POT family proton-dependent oligopeptide transporter